METAIPLFPCKSLKKPLDFYQTLGFEITFQQHDPYPYAAVTLREFALHFSRLTMYGSNAFGSCLVFVPDVGNYYHRFANGLRQAYGRIPTADNPRIARLRTGHTRFKVFDPTGNMVTYINHNEPDAAYGWSEADLSPLGQALDMAVFLRDVYANDKAAVKTLDKALQKHTTATPIDRDRALAALAELAVALGDDERAHTARHELKQIPLSDEDRTRYHEELHAADTLEQWLT